MSAKHSKILSRLCTYYGAQRYSKCQQKHSFDKLTPLGQPTGFTHPHLMNEDEITPGISRDEYTQRRTSLINLLRGTHYGESKEKHIIIISASPQYYMAPDVPYPFRQNSNFLYLTGYQEEDTVLIIETGSHTAKGLDYNTILFTQSRNLSKEIWDGPRNGIEGAVNHFGFDEAFPISELGEILKKRYNDNYNIWYDHLKPTHLHMNKEITDVLFNTASFTFSRIHRVGHLVETLRLIKSPSEISLLKKCASITSHAFIETMKKTKPDMLESYLQSVLEYECTRFGADRLSFPPVVAGGSMANTLHYISNNHMLRSGKLVLVDGGCEYNGYCSDVTRVWPVDGKFTKPQRELYEVILEIQRNCIKLCQVGKSLDQIYKGMISLMEKEFEALGFLPGAFLSNQKQQLIRNLCPHHVGHYLGMDVHDSESVSKNLTLEEGIVISVEPGIYVRSDGDAPSRFHGIGIRIEDDILITNEGPVVLTSECPKDVDELEEVMAQDDLR